MSMPINPAQLQELKSFLGDDINDLLADYLKDSLVQMKQIHAAYEQADLNLATNSVQSLKGASANIGATELETLCHKLYAECKAGRLRASDVIIHALDEELGRVNRYLRAEFL
jgi:HPt (histidine-containing phosphotransfer) domain-containing protein